MARTQLPVRADPLRAYLHRIGQFPVLTPEEERGLAVRWFDQHDVEAARRLVLSNLRFVVKIANQYRRYGLRPMDLILEGTLGLMVAVKRFDPHRGIRLISYAVFWIRAYILSFILRSWRLVRIGTTRAQRRLFFKLRETEHQLKQAGGDEAAASAGAVGRALGVDAEDVVEMDGLLGGRDLSLDAPAHGPEAADARAVIEVLPSGAPDPEQLVAEAESRTLRRHRIRAALAGLTPREREIIQRRYLADHPPSLAELGRERGVSRERMRQVEARALAKLRATLARESPDVLAVGAAPPAAPAAVAQAA